LNRGAGTLVNFDGHRAARDFGFSAGLGARRHLLVFSRHSFARFRASAADLGAGKASERMEVRPALHEVDGGRAHLSAIQKEHSMLLGRRVPLLAGELGCRLLADRLALATFVDTCLKHLLVVESRGNGHEYSPCNAGYTGRDRSPAYPNSWSGVRSNRFLVGETHLPLNRSWFFPPR